MEIKKHFDFDWISAKVKRKTFLVNIEAIVTLNVGQTWWEDKEKKDWKKPRASQPWISAFDVWPLKNLFYDNSRADTMIQDKKMSALIFIEEKTAQD
jgi:hypothetical protein